jgi:hypothetical protein
LFTHLSVHRLLGYCEYCYCELDCANLCVGLAFCSFQYTPRSRIARSSGISRFTFLRSCHSTSQFHEQCTRYKVSHISSSSLTLVLCALFSFIISNNHPNVCEVMFYGFDLYFPKVDTEYLSCFFDSFLNVKAPTSSVYLLKMSQYFTVYLF